MTERVSQVRSHRGYSSAIARMFIAAMLLHLIGETSIWID